MPASRIVPTARTPLLSRRDGANETTDLGVTSSYILKIRRGAMAHFGPTGTQRAMQASTRRRVLLACHQPYLCRIVQDQPTAPAIAVAVAARAAKRVQKTCRRYLFSSKASRLRSCQANHSCTKPIVITFTD